MRNRIVFGLLALAVVGLLVAGGLFAAVPAINAQSPTPPAVSSQPLPRAGVLARLAQAVRARLGTRVTITGINGTTLSVSTANATRTVSTNSNTRFLPAGQTISLADLKVGDVVWIRGRNVNGTLTATVIRVVVPRVTGVISAVGAGTLTLQHGNLTVTVVTTSTTVVAQGKQTLALSDLKVGDRVTATGKPNEDGTFTAEHIAKVLPCAAGRVTAISGATLTIQQGYYHSRVITDSSTVLMQAGKLMTLSDIKVGSLIRAQGTPDGAGTLKAAQVNVLPSNANP